MRSYLVLSMARRGQTRTGVDALRLILKTRFLSGNKELFCLERQTKSIKVDELPPLVNNAGFHRGDQPQRISVRSSPQSTVCQLIAGLAPCAITLS